MGRAQPRWAGLGWAGLGWTGLATTPDRWLLLVLLVLFALAHPSADSTMEGEAFDDGWPVPMMSYVREYCPVLPCLPWSSVGLCQAGTKG